LTNLVCSTFIVRGDSRTTYLTRCVGVVELLASCANWAYLLLAWLADGLFNLLDDAKFMSLLNGQQLPEAIAYLQSQNDPSLQWLLSSSTRALLTALCRRLDHLDTLGKMAMRHTQSRAAGGLPSNRPEAIDGYRKIHALAETAMVKSQALEKLLSTLNADIRDLYQNSLMPQARKSSAALAAQIQQQKAPPEKMQQALQAVSPEALVKRQQLQCEISILLGNSPPPSFLNVIVKFFQKDLVEFRAQTNPNTLFFADYSLLAINDDQVSLAMGPGEGYYVDVFRKGGVIWKKGMPGPQELEPADATLVNQRELQLRRCVRCAAVMVQPPIDLSAPPGFTFVLGQQRKCSCSGSFALLPYGSRLL
jgi:mediator of RNA polymerase II transcription subunit 16, fungi type